MPGKFRKLARNAFILFTVIMVVLYLLVCLVPFLKSGNFWFIAMLGLGFPFLAVALVLCILGWLIKKSRWAFVPLVALLLGWQQLSVMAGLRLEKKFNVDKGENTLRVLTWNVSRWDEHNKALRGGESFRRLMLDVVQIQNADILCFQEFFECTQPERFEPNISTIGAMGYPYHYFFPSIKIHQGTSQFGLCIFSRYPILDSAQSLNGAMVHAEGFCYIDIKVQEKVFRVFNAKLESVGLSKTDYEGLGQLDGSRTIASKIKASYRYRNEQAKGVRVAINESPYPVIVCGDLDDVPNSYAYFTLRGGLQDAFLKKGSGLGRTLRFISPTLRIDYIFADKKFSVEQYSRIKVPYSDHYPVVADVRFTGK